MNKRKVVLTSLLGFTLLFGCSQVEEKDKHVGEYKVSAEELIPVNFEVVSKSDVDDFTYTYELLHKQTKCHFMYVSGSREGGLTQMFIEKDGVTIPYCEK